MYMNLNQKYLFLCLFLSLSFSIHSKDEVSRLQIPEFPLPFTEGLPSSTVASCVDAISGLYFEHEVDLTLFGPENLHLERTYLSLVEGWRPHTFSCLSIEAEEGLGRHCRYFEPNANTIHCSGTRKKKDEFVTLSVDFAKSKGFTNCGRGEISGQTHLKNIHLKIHEGFKEAPVAWDGKEEKRFFDYRIKSERGTFYLLTEIVKPTGNKIKYQYDKLSKFEDVTSYETSRMTAVDTRGIETGYFTFQHLSDKEFKKTPFLKVSAGDGREVRYDYKIISKHKIADMYAKNNDQNQRYYITKVTRPNAPAVEYEYCESTVANYAKVSRKKWLEDRFVAIDYYPEKDPNKEIRFLVKAIKAPVGINKEPVVTHNFAYNINADKSGYTDVRDAVGNLTRYHYSNEQRLTNIQNFFGDHLYTSQEFTWGTSGVDAGNLLSMFLKESNGKVVYGHEFQYDNSGNITVDTIKGNLTGQDHAIDSYAISYQYNAQNLLISATDDNRIFVKYSYYPNRLVASKLLVVDGKILMREFYSYDPNGTLIKKITDDGCSEKADILDGATERHIQTIVPKPTPHCMGFPQEIRNSVLNISTGHEKLLNKTVNTYSNEGFLLRQDTYDGNGEYRFSIDQEFDYMGNPTKVIDPLNQITLYEYDKNGNCTKETDSRNFSKKHEYDYMNRLIKTDECLDNNEHLITRNSYNTLNQKVKSCDAFGQETHYTYDPLGRLTQVVMPPIMNHKEKKLESPTTTMSYNALGQCLETKDANGQITKTKYTIRNKPYRVDYHDGTFETFQYARSGELLEHRSRLGVITTYEYDYLKRPIQETIESCQDGGCTHSIKLYQYNAFHLIKSTDARGIETNFSYDSAGRPSAIVKDGSLTEFEYDSLGRMSKTKEWYTEGEYICKEFRYDLLNRVIEEIHTNTRGDLQKKTSYAYDQAGNQIEVALNDSVTKTQYNALKQPILVTDAEGNVSFTHYDYAFINHLHQTVIQKTFVDSSGTLTITTYDTHGNVAKIERKNPFGIDIAKQEIFYDKLGNKLLTIDTCYPDKKEILTEFEYDSAGRLTCLKEASGKAEQKVTRYQYNPLGQKKKTIKPDGVVLNFAYDPIGRLEKYSSEGSFNYTYIYDDNHNLIQVYDSIHNQTTIRNYDGLNQLSKEILGNGIELKFDRDRQGRLTKLTLPDKSPVFYQYDGSLLRSIKKDDYEHLYQEYDLAGSLIQSQLMGQAGVLTNSWDKLLRPTSIITNRFTEQNITYDNVGNLVSLFAKDPLGETNCTYAYDDWYQLKNEEGLCSHKFVHDSLQNRISQDKTSYEYNQLHQLLREGGNKYTYDPNGNLIGIDSTEGKIQFSYDALDRLVTVTDASEKVTYSYDAFNRRLGKEIYTLKQGEWTLVDSERYFYQGENEIGSYDHKNQMNSLRVLGNGKGAEIGASILMVLDKKPYVPIHDHNGNVRCLLEAETGNVAESYRYSVFGEEQLSGDTALSPWRFSSKRVDPETGFIYFGRRYYSPKIGRWITQDPEGAMDGPNLYAYVGNNPLIHVDLYGLYADRNRWVRSGDSWMSPRLARDSRYNPRAHRDSWGRQPSPFQVLGNMIGLGRHLPIPGVNRVFDTVGRFFQGQGLSWEDPNHYRSRVIQGAGGLTENANIVIGYINGQLTELSESIQQTDSASAKFNDSKMTVFYGETNYLGVDSLETLSINAGLLNKKLASHLNELKNSIGKLSLGQIYLLIGWSRGAAEANALIQGLTPAEKQKLYVVTLGGAKMITDKSLVGYRNFVDFKDVVPFVADPIGVLRGLKNGDVQRVYSSCLPFCGHTFNNDGYQTALGQFAKEFIIKYGE